MFADQTVGLRIIIDIGLTISSSNCNFLTSPFSFGLMPKKNVHHHILKWLIVRELYMISREIIYYSIFKHLTCFHLLFSFFLFPNAPVPVHH
jgi:hypothetical protein